jgi:hypothetical protein
VEAIAELKAILFPFLSLYLKLKELFEDEMIAKFIDRQ